MTRLGVFGWPVAHSRSPAMHNAAFAALAMEGWHYQLLPVPPRLFAEVARALPASGFLGANVTVPHKQAALAVAAHASDDARAIGAANVLTARDGGLYAENTDAPGLLTALGVSPAGMRALILGAGGSARAAAFALREAGAADICVWNRTPARAAELARELGVRAAAAPEPADVLVNCTSVGLPGSSSMSSISGPERALRDEHLAAVDGVSAVAGCGAHERGRGTAIDEIDDMGVLTDQIERQRELVELRNVTGRGL